MNECPYIVGNECDIDRCNAFFDKAKLLDKVAERIKSGCTCPDYSCGVTFNKDCANCSNYMIDYPSAIEVIEDLKANIKEKENKNMESGRIEIEGLQYEDLVIILTTNGYDVQVTVNATHNATSNKYVIDYKPHDYIGECMNGA